MLGAPTAVLAKVGVPYSGLIAVAFTDFVDVPELAGSVGVGGLLLYTIRLSISHNKSLLADYKELIDELRDENTRLREKMKND